ncbi:MAG: hypothetical protein WBL45_09125 [Solirubrobacterales bacterium]
MSRKDRFRQSRTPAREAAERIERVVEAAERAAETVIDDAEKRAKAYLSGAQAEADRVASERLASLTELTDTLLSQAEAIGRQAEGLLATIEQVKTEIGADAGKLQALEDPPRERTSHLTAVAEPEDPQPEQGQGSPAGARLLATQMAVSGNSREEIELRLRNGFEIADTTAILDAILGPEE